MLPSRCGVHRCTTNPVVDHTVGEIVSVFTDPINSDPLLRTVKLPDGRYAIDLECAEALMIAPALLPKPSEIRDRPGRPASRWVYDARPKL
jgi:hypothetical protein